jgi:pyrroloquinoline quinone (PQQ) biosynthesis protein C
LNTIIFYQKSTNIQNQIEQKERELKIRNYSPKTIKSYIYGLKEYFAFKKQDFENLNEEIKVRSAKKNKSLPVVLSMIKMREARFWPKMKFVLIFFQVLWQFLETVSQRVNACA